MDIYVKSRGVSFDYYWQKVEQAKLKKQEPNLPEGILKLIDSEYLSLVLFRSEKKLILLITSLDTQSRTDSRMRKIRNSIVWIGDDNHETEAILRSLVVYYCKNVDNLVLQIDRAVASTKDGFSVDYSELPSLEIDKQLSNKLPDLSLKIGNLENLRDKLAEELQKSQIPADKEGFLIVLSEVNSKKSFQSAQVWRGLSKQIESDDWENIQADSNFFRKPSKQNKGGNSRSMATTMTEEKKASLNILTLILSLCLIVSVIGNIWQWNQLNENKNKQNTLTSKLEELTSKINTENEKLKELKKDVEFYRTKKENLEGYFQNIKENLNKAQEDLNKTKEIFNEVDNYQLSNSNFPS